MKFWNWKAKKIKSDDRDLTKQLQLTTSSEALAGANWLRN
jgi:hypothetical protein